MIDQLLMATRGFNIVKSGVKRKLRGRRRYSGSAEEICEQIVRSCYDSNAGYFRTSRTTYQQFWSRDFGRVVEPLLKLGFQDEVTSSYRYALSHYEKYGRFSLVITKEGLAFDFPLNCYSPDGFAFFLHGLAKLQDKALIREYTAFLEAEVLRFAEIVVDPKDGMVRRDRHFSEAQDFVIRKSSCYSNVMLFVLKNAIDQLNLVNPLEKFDYAGIMKKEFVDGNHIFDDMAKKRYLSADATILPFWAGIFGTDNKVKRLFKRVLGPLDDNGLTFPIAARYGVGAEHRRMIALHKLHPWQRDAIWTCLGMHLLEASEILDTKRYKEMKRIYIRLLERLGCFPEVLDASTLDIYSSRFFMTEDSMIWAANLWAHLVH